jgi:hypothetical protein
VKWVQSRTHFLILHAKHGPKISRGGQHATFTDSEEPMTRSAHRRRAHFRTLNSERFTVKKGWRIAVREAWIGPKEWMGSDKKTYAIVQSTQMQPMPEFAPKKEVA